MGANRPTQLLSALIDASTARLATDLAAAGIRVIQGLGSTQLVQDAVRVAPDMVIIDSASPEDALFVSTKALQSLSPRPVIVFTTDPDAGKIERATQSGVHAYVVNGYSPNRLRSVIHLAQARFRTEQLLRDELVDVNQRFAERKLIDQAKGILMGARQLREDEAYRVLRSAAMGAKQRIGQVAQQVITQARYAEAVNRAGQLRMLSQRVVKLYALAVLSVRAAETAGLAADSRSQADQNLTILSRSLSRSTFGDLIDAVQTPWTDLAKVLAQPPLASRMPEIDALAEEVLACAERLTVNLEVAGLAAALHVINVAGRQRMLSQRLVKQALIATLATGTTARAARAAMTGTRAELVAGFAFLDMLPLSNAEIGEQLEHTRQSWDALQQGLAQVDTAAGLESVAVSSEVLLAQFDRLTDHLERAIQMLMR